MSLLQVRTYYKKNKFSNLIYHVYLISIRLADNTTIRIGKNTHTELLKVMGQIQARTGKIPTLDDALKELLENYKKKKV